ncbi:MAG: hypothetical protein J3Q66DRAFT_439167 [Benniella sp.]|nr:MAG: hypothetical protein J3Q66DRAFT_439167 [Benniella sp.]
MATSKQLEQAFRADASSEIIAIPTRLDNETGQHVILWRDIQQYFEDAIGIVNNGEAVQFLADDKLNDYLPLRIAHHPGIELVVVTGDTGGHATHSPAEWDFQSNDRDNLSRKLGILSINNASLPILPGGKAINELMHAKQNSPRTLSDGYNMDPDVRSRVLLERVVQMQEANNQRQQQLIRMHQQSLHMQQQTLDRMGIIQGSIQTLVTQTYELHEYPIPRLFIVLPNSTRDASLKLLPHHFRLYFLCECGIHTVHEDSTTPHEIHLAKHNGYDIDNPTEFFDKYGTYVLALMHMFKMGVSTAGLVVPSLASFKIEKEEELGEFPQLLDCMRNIVPLVDDSIAFLENLKGVSGESTMKDSMQVNRMEIVEKVDLKHLESHLKIKDDDVVLGNLHRIVTSKGHVKWVCSDHHRASSQQPASTKLREVVTAHNGTLKEDVGEIRIDFSSSHAAKQFYNALNGVCWIQKLRIGLLWDASMDELKRLAETVTKANIIDLTIEGGALLGRNVDMLHRFNRFDPLWQLRTSEKLQTLRLVLFKDLFYRLSPNAFLPSPKLRTLKLHSPIDGGVHPWKTNLQKVLESCPNINEFGLRLQDQELVVQAMNDILAKLPNLRSLELYFGEFHTAATVAQGKVRAIQLYQPFTKDLIAEDSNYKTYSKVLDEKLILAQAQETMHQNSVLSEIRIGYHQADVNSMIKAIVSTRQDIMVTGKGTALRKVIFTRIQESDDTQPVEITMDFTVKPESPFDLSVKTGKGGFGTSSTNFFRDYGWCIKALDARNEGFDDKIAELLDRSTKEKGSRLESLALNTKVLSQVGLDQMDQVISRSQSLQQFLVDCQSLDIELEREKGKWVSRHGKQLTGLSLQGDGSGPATKWLIEAFPTRLTLPKLIDLQLVLPCRSDLQDSHLYISWITTMVSAPSSRMTAVSSPSSKIESTAMGPSDVARNNLETWPSLSKLVLRLEKLAREDWAKVIGAIDFSALEVLDLTGTNFAVEELDHLIKRISDVDGVAPLKTLDLSLSTLSNYAHLNGLHPMVDKIKENAPHATIKGL